MDQEWIDGSIDQSRINQSNNQSIGQWIIPSYRRQREKAVKAYPSIEKWPPSKKAKEQMSKDKKEEWL